MSSSGRQILVAFACKCAAPGTAMSGEGHIRLLGKIMQLRHTHPRLISRPMRHLHVCYVECNTCSHTKSFLFA